MFFQTASIVGLHLFFRSFEENLPLRQGVARLVGERAFGRAVFDDGEAEAAFGGVGAVDDGAGFGQVLQYGRARLHAAAGE